MSKEQKFKQYDVDTYKFIKEVYMNDFRNESDYEFIDISSEEYRCYVFDNDGNEVLIKNPLKLAVSNSGHRVWDGKKSHFIPNDWIQLYWEVKDGCPHFVK